jgi:hypothetical protein
MSEVKVNKISPRSGTEVTLGDSGDTFTIPAGATLTNNGTASGFAAIDWQSTVVTGTTHTASANQGIWIDTTSNACTLTLPSSPSVGDQLIFSDFARTWASNAVTLTLNGSNYQGNTTPVPVYDTEGETVHIVYSGSTQGWIPINDGAVALETPQLIDTEYLIVAGGGAGGKANAGGGGAGGLLTNFGGTAITLTPGAVYTVTVGAGGAAVSSNGRGGAGSNSVLSGTGITTLTAIGGGGGGSDAAFGGVGGDGGSGGGSDYDSNTGGSGTVGQGNDGGDANNPTGEFGAGGGGGAGAAGTGGSTSAGGVGGVGLSNSITGSAVFYAGGGGGSTATSNAGAGGNGGGGAGGSAAPGGGTDGTDGLGGGGGGVDGGSPSGAGGDGVVILRVATADYSGTTTGSPTVDTDGTDTILTFTASGSYTA